MVCLSVSEREATDVAKELATSIAPDPASYPFLSYDVSTLRVQHNALEVSRIYSYLTCRVYLVWQKGHSILTYRYSTHQEGENSTNGKDIIELGKG